MSDGVTLNSIGLKHRTDKSSSNHDYLRFYEHFFAGIRNEKLTILEIGILNGGSLKTWEEYFPAAKIIGADINPLTRRFERDRVSVEILDQSNVEELTQLAVKHGPFDIVIEDGSHMWEHQLTSLRTIFPFVRNGGYYIVEDLQTNYGAISDNYKGVSSISCVGYLKKWLDLYVGDDQLPIGDEEDAFLRTYGRAADFITFYRRACVIKKRYASVLRMPPFGLPLVHLGSGPGLVAVGVLAHVSHRGDVYGIAGYVNLPSDAHAFQGVAIESTEDVLEYRVRWPDQTWSEWAPTNTFVGTRGQAKLLSGVTIRLREDAKDRYALRTIGRFAEMVEHINAGDGEDCASATGDPLCGLQIELTRHVPTS